MPIRPAELGTVTLMNLIADCGYYVRPDLRHWIGCIAGALTRGDYVRGLEAAGFVDVELRETHRVHEHAGSAIIRARKP
jgi:arsenite methyltransferase